MATTIAPSTGTAPSFLQAGPGASPGYSAIDFRRAISGAVAEGVLSSGSYAVTERAAGANLSVDIAASTGNGAYVQGDSVTSQGIYHVPPHSAVINEAITAADATNPRVDQVILEVGDDTHAAGGINLARVRVVAGTPTSGATLVNRSGAASLPVSALRLADVLVPALDTTISNSQIADRRTFASPPLALAEANLKIIRGSVTSAGAIGVGGGFTSAKDATGSYTVTFTVPFSAVPSVTGSPNVDAACFVVPHTPAVGSAQFRTKSDAGANEDRAFSFIAIGPA